jgi:hypothetical protein
MKSSELAELLEQWVVVAPPQHTATAGLSALVRILHAYGSKTVASTAAKLSKVESQSTGEYDASWGPALDYLQPIVRMFAPYGKPAVAKDLKCLVELFSPKRHLAVSSFSKAAVDIGVAPAKLAVPIRIDVVQKYNRLLERALGDDAGFNEALSEIEDPKNVSTSEVIALAKQFALASAKSRAAALKKIRARHEALLVGRAKSAATGGRVAG